MVPSMAIGNWYHSIQMFIGHHILAISTAVAPRHFIPLVALIAVGVAAAVIQGRRTNRRLRNPEIRGPALRGRARVLSVEQLPGSEAHPIVLRIGLRVEVPGHPVYDVKIERSVQVIHVSRLQTGAIFPVWVDETNPEKVRIDFIQLMT
jgi:hypothetical protein